MKIGVGRSGVEKLKSCFRQIVKITLYCYYQTAVPVFLTRFRVTGHQAGNAYCFVINAAGKSSAHKKAS